ncbi:hypothetical protein [Neobacillus sp.]|uniref:hypothetical protein n=1 Tax=Neobacillus sp. TaxID=2675273 RepID=UPI0035B516FA
MNYKILDNSPIKLSNLEIEVDELLTALQNTNRKFEEIYFETKKLKLDIFSIIDFRNLSGIVGEAFAKELAHLNKKLAKNPSLDGYPDLVQISTPEMKSYFDSCEYEDFKKFKYGGVEVKNTFGTKKSNSDLLVGEQRINYINRKLDWKAHHRETNFLIALLSDYINGVPKIVALCYSDNLIPEDWQKKQNPKVGSAMTSFSTIEKSGVAKLKQGIKICINDQKYLDFLTKE